MTTSNLYILKFDLIVPKLIIDMLVIVCTDGNGITLCLSKKREKAKRKRKIASFVIVLWKLNLASKFYILLVDKKDILYIN